jgi:hypothetical protein
MHKETHHNNRKLAFLKATIALSRNKTTFTLGFPKSDVFIEVEISFQKKIAREISHTAALWRTQPSIVISLASRPPVCDCRKKRVIWYQVLVQ